VTGDKYPVDIDTTDPLNGLLWLLAAMLTQRSYFGADGRGAA